MRPANRFALTPARLATDGEQGEGAKADGHCGAEHSPHGCTALFLARVAIDAAQAQLDAYALVTDEPRLGMVEAADLLDAARAALDGVPMTGPRLTGNRCQCTVCGLLFSSVREFDRHRIGTYAEAGTWRGNRRCLTRAELIARNWRTNARGYWMQPRLQHAPVRVEGPRVTLPATQVHGAMR